MHIQLVNVITIICFQILVRSNTSALKGEDIYIALMEIGKLFGKQHKAPTADFQIFAPFDNQKNVLFQVRTRF